MSPSRRADRRKTCNDATGESPLAVPETARSPNLSTQWAKPAPGPTPGSKKLPGCGVTRRTLQRAAGRFRVQASRHQQLLGQGKKLMIMVVVMLVGNGRWVLGVGASKADSL